MALHEQLLTLAGMMRHKNNWDLIPWPVDRTIAQRQQCRSKISEKEPGARCNLGLSTPHKHEDPTEQADSSHDVQYDLLTWRSLRFCHEQNFGRSLRGHGLELLVMTVSRTT